MESGDRLVDALAEEKNAADQGTGYPEDVTTPERWRTASRAVRHAAEYYTIALENYRQAVLSELARRKPRDPQ